MIKLGKNILIKMLSVATAAVMLAGLIPAGNAGAAQVDTGKKGSITVTYSSVDDKPLSGVKAHIYRVASVDAAGKYTILSDYEGAFSDQDFFNTDFKFDEWKTCVSSLKDYISNKKLAAYKDGKSDSEGKAVFKDLDLGVYLVVSDTLKDNKYVYSFSSFVYPVPLLEMDEAKGVLDWHYDVTVTPKKKQVEKTAEEKFTVYKRWNDSGYENNRPSSITVEIYCDGDLYKKVKLDSSNNWQYSWKYEAGHEWKLVETSSGKNYSASLTTDKKDNTYTFVFTNTYNPPKDPPKDPEDPSDPGTPDNPATPSTPSTPTSDSLLPGVLGALRRLPQVLGARRLPQTGQLWWPIPLLVLAGLFFIIKGIRKNIKNA